MNYEIGRAYTYAQLGTQARAALRRKVRELRKHITDVDLNPQGLTVTYDGMFPGSRRFPERPQFSIVHPDMRVATVFLVESVS